MPQAVDMPLMLHAYPHSDNSVTLQALETRAYGHRFRSRLEARYAVFLTELGVRWQYEPEGFALKAGPYLPDFFLPDVNGGTWLEIKPHGAGSFWDERLVEFAQRVESSNQSFFIAYGIPSRQFLEGWVEYEAEGILDAIVDPHMWCICRCGKTPGIQFDGRSDRIDCKHAGCTKSSHGDKGYSHNHWRIALAAEAARSARFEHGEAP